MKDQLRTFQAKTAVSPFVPPFLPVYTEIKCVWWLFFNSTAGGIININGHS